MIRIYYDREGNPITSEEYTQLSHTPGYKRIEVTNVGSARISTVWLGVDHATITRPLERPVIFETMVFGDPDDNDRMRRYSTEEEARVGHAVVVKEVQRAGRPLARFRRAVQAWRKR